MLKYRAKQMKKGSHLSYMNSSKKSVTKLKNEFKRLYVNNLGQNIDNQFPIAVLYVLYIGTDVK